MAHFHLHQQQQYEESNAQIEENPTLLLDALYCSEEHWEEDEQEEVEDNYHCNSYNKPSPFPVLLEQDLYWDDEELISLFSKEQKNEVFESLNTDPYLAGARREAVDWILRVMEHYSFSALTAVLAVNYFDRFLFGFQFQQGKPWMTQLAAVACLSLAAKVEETQVPLLLDLQVCTLLNESWLCLILCLLLLCFIQSSCLCFV